MIDNNIIQSLGAGSGIDTRNLVKQLVSIERSAPQERIDSQREKAETQISDYGIVKSALSTLQDAAKILTDPEGMFSKTASFTESTALVPTELTTDVQPGVYTLEVNDIAQSASYSSGVFASKDDAVGEGTLTFNFGDWESDLSGFTANTDRESFTVTIDSSNNSLEGLRDAINDADAGVQASIVNNGSGYVLQITAPSGQSNELEIVVSESGGSPTNADASDLSRFSFTTGGFQLSEDQEGKDARLTINGLSVTRETNVVDDVVSGLKLDILSAAPGEPVTITVTDDKAFAEQNVRDFVAAYNTFLEVLDPLFGATTRENDDGEKETVQGSLANDSLAKSILSRIRTSIASAIPGLASSNYTSLTNIGIRTELDGTLSIDEDDFKEAFNNNFEDVQKLLSPLTESSNADIKVNSFNDNTTAGEYDVVITTPPARGFYQGNAIDASVVFPDYDSTGRDYSFTISVNGTESQSLTLPTATYATQDELAAAIQSVINADTNLQEAGVSVTASYDSVNNRFDIVSTSYGTSSTVNITAASANIADDLGLAVANGTAGVKVAGTINGVPGFGSANVLLPDLDEPGAGLAMIIGENATSATVNFSRGFAGELNELISSFLASDGVIALREESLETQVESFDDDQGNLDRRMSAYEERLMRQFIAMERILNGLSNSGSFLDNLIDTLPFTAKRD